MHKTSHHFGHEKELKSENCYQQNPANHDEAITEIELDLQEGADMIMIKGTQQCFYFKQIGSKKHLKIPLHGET